MSSLVTVRDLGFKSGPREILSHIDLTIEPGELVSLIGPNGAGKTTLIRAILGLIKPDSGSVTRSPGLSIGYMPQRLVIAPTLPLPVHRFLALGGRVSQAECRQALEEVGAEDIWGTQVSQVSGGEFQRMLLALAVLRKPRRAGTGGRCGRPDGALCADRLVKGQPWLQRPDGVP